jgi:porin
LGLGLLTPISGWAAHLQEQLDEWNFLRSHLDVRGITLETVNTTDVGSNINHKGTNRALVIGDIDLLLTLNAEKLIGWDGGTVFLYGLGLYGGSISEGTDAQGADNISAQNTWKLFEAWYQQNCSVSAQVGQFRRDC